MIVIDLHELTFIPTNQWVTSQGQIGGSKGVRSNIDSKTGF